MDRQSSLVTAMFLVGCSPAVDVAADACGGDPASECAAVAAVWVGEYTPTEVNDAPDYGGPAVGESERIIFSIDRARCGISGGMRLAGNSVGFIGKLCTEASGEAFFLRDTGGLQLSFDVGDAAASVQTGTGTFDLEILVDDPAGSAETSLVGNFAVARHAPTPQTAVCTEACADNNPCTDDSCTSDGTCVHVDNSRDCDDGDGCTVGDRCANGGCVSGATRDCDDNEMCTSDRCDTTSGACIHLPIMGTCTDGDPCTELDTCQFGTCVGTPVVPCCNNGTCEGGGEDCNSCPAECPGVTTGPNPHYCCGDGTPDTPEGDGTICDGNY